MSNPHDFHIKWTIEWGRQMNFKPQDFRDAIRGEQMRRHNSMVLSCRTGRPHGAMSRLERLETMMVSLKAGQMADHLDYEIAHEHRKRIEALEALSTPPSEITP